MTLWHVPDELEIGVIPRKIYCNRDLVTPLRSALINLVSRGYAESELLTWDGCFNIRQIRGSLAMSLHSWGLAVDVNAFANPLGRKPTDSRGFVECWTDAGLTWGGKFTRQDGMHYELTGFPS